MATSPLFGWQEPDDTSLVKDGAAAIRTLGNAIDTSMGDLLGGTTGQVLAKASNTNMDFTWVAQDDSNAIQNAIVDAKGDLISATANDTPARLAVGANNTKLVAASGETTGLKWVGYQGTSVYQSATSGTSIASGVYTLLLFDSEDFDTDSFHSTSTNTGRITIPTGMGGKYLVTTSCWWDLVAAGNRQTQIFKNGSAIIETPSTLGSTAGYLGPFWSGVLNLVPGDYLEMYVYQNTGAALTVYAREKVKPFSVTYLGA